MKKLMMLAAMLALVLVVGVVPALAQPNGFFDPFANNGFFGNNNGFSDPFANNNGLNGNGFFDPFGNNGFFGDGLNGNGGGGNGITQDVQPQSGNVSLDNQVSNTGNYSSQCTPALQNGNTGNFTNSPAIEQYGGRSGAIEPEGIQVDFGSGSVTADCPSTIEQSSSASSSGYDPSQYYSSGY